MAGNLGGPAMILSMVEGLAARGQRPQVTLLSKYPADDGPPCRRHGFAMRAFPTRVQLVAGLPFALLYGALRLLRLPRRWLARGPFTPYVESDLLIDLSGISFSDYRPLSGLLINVLWLLPALATGIPWVKASQAMGPFERLPVRLAARFVLGRAAALAARGSDSERHVKRLLPGARVRGLPDLAFNLAPAAAAEVDDALAAAGLGAAEPYCIVGPSCVLDRRLAATGAEPAYPELMARAADRLAELSGGRVLLVAHERATTGTHLDDLAICEQTRRRSRRPDRLLVLDGDHGAPLLKGIVARARVVVGSRFHLMVAAMSSEVPGIAVGWSHKYREMMRGAGQEELALSGAGLDAEALVGTVERLWSRRDEIRRELAAQVPAVRARAAQNAELALAAIGRAAANADGTERAADG
jgi:polysaccharide pyruvyl transferase WcaK-like protein